MYLKQEDRRNVLQAQDVEVSSSEIVYGMWDFPKSTFVKKQYSCSKIISLEPRFKLYVCNVTSKLL